MTVAVLGISEKNTEVEESEPKMMDPDTLIAGDELKDEEYEKVNLV